MGIFNRLSMLFTGAPKAEVDAVNNALRDVALQSLVVDDIEPAERTFTPNRKQRRDHAHSLRYRDRNTKFSQRSRVLTGKQLHKAANDKGAQATSNDLLGKLLGRLPSFQSEVSA